MEHAGLRSGQISQVRGFADRQLRVPSDPLDPSNRRISVIVHYVTVPNPGRFFRRKLIWPHLSRCEAGRVA